MLKGLDPLLGADLLQVLRAMGHGDDLVIADANFPATTMGRRLVRLDGVAAPRALEAVLSVMPLDDFVAEPCGRIEVVGDPAAVPEVCREFQQHHRPAPRAAGSKLGEDRALRVLRARPRGVRGGPDRRDPPLWLRAAQDGRGPPGLTGPGGCRSLQQ